MGSLKWVCIYVYAVEKMAQSEGKVCREKPRGSDDACLWINLMARIVQLGLKMMSPTLYKRKPELR